MSQLNTNRMLNLPLNIPHRYKKGLIKLFTGNPGGGIPAPFYYTTAVVQEGAPMMLGSTQDLILPCPQGSAALCFGLAMQNTYDESTWDPQLKGLHFANNTRQRLDGSPIGILTGKGYAVTLNTAVPVAYGQQAYIAASGYLGVSGTNGATSTSMLPIVYEGTADAGTPVRIRFAFKFMQGE
jgi:hypothetical protein